MYRMILFVTNAWLTMSPGVLGLLTVKPENITAYVGDNVTMSCTTSLPEAVDWRRKLPSADRFEIFCFRGHIKAGYGDKFSISNPQQGSYRVTVKNVQRSDSGEYRCIEGVDQDPNYATVVLAVYDRNYVTTTTSSISHEHESTTSVVAVPDTDVHIHVEPVIFIVIITCLLIMMMMMCLLLVILCRRLTRRHDVHTGDDVVSKPLIESSEDNWKRNTSVNHLHRDDLETVLLKAAALMCHKTNGEDCRHAVNTLCTVSRMWWRLMRNCHTRKKTAFQRYIDSLQNCRRAHLKVRFDMNARVCGVAYLDDDVSKIYVICGNWNTICVFHAAPPYEQLRGISMNGLREPTDIAACADNKLLYVSDHAEGCVWQVTTGGKVDKRLPTWAPIKRKASSVYPVSLSVGFGRVVVVEIGKILVYDLHDDKVDEIDFPDSVALHHAMETDRRSYVVALSDKSAEIPYSTVREMYRDERGEWLPGRECNLQSCVTSPTHNLPMYMARDTSGFFYVAIRGSRKVLVLDKELNIIQSVRLNVRSMPNRLCFLGQKQKQLLVADAGFGVNVYD